MKFELYTDEVVLDKNKVNNKQSILYLDNFLGGLINQVQNAGIGLEDTIYFYKRNKKGESVLGIQIAEGDIEDLSNYLVFECRSKIVDDEVKCVTGFQIDEKHNDVWFEVPYSIAASAMHFFERIEKSSKDPIAREREYDTIVSTHYDLQKIPCVGRRI